MIKRIIKTGLFLLAAVLPGWVQTCQAKPMELTFYGLADASAAVFLDAKHFVVADDESNILRTYSIDKPKGPVSTLNLDKFLDIDPASPEVDIEAAARVGDRIYWISSHGRNKSGKIRESRYRFFCTEIVPAKHGKKTSPGVFGHWSAKGSVTLVVFSATQDLVSRPTEPAAGRRRITRRSLRFRFRRGGGRRTGALSLETFR